MPTNIAINLGGQFRQNQLPKSGFQEVHPTGGQEESVQQAAPHEALEELWKRVLPCSASLVWSRAPRFDACLHTCTMVPPFAYKSPGISRTKRGKVLRSFSVALE